MGRRELLRIQTRVKVEFKTFDQFYQEYTNNLSKGGIFIKTDKALAPQTVIEINLILPGLDQPLALVGEVVHVIDPETAKARGWDPGIGVHFIDFEEGGQQLLEEYIAEQYKKQSGQRLPDRRKHPRASIRLRVKFPSLEVLHQDYSEDISRGGIFIQTNKPREVGELFLITLVHPETGEELELEGEVVRVSKANASEPGNASGMGIRFVGVDENKHQAIDRFLGLA